MGTLFDISQFKWAESVQKRRIEEALEAKRQQEKYNLSSIWMTQPLTCISFIDMNSHELRNPLSAVVQCADSVMASLEHLLTDTTNPSSIRLNSTQVQDAINTSIDALQTIVSCSLHQKRVIDDVLTLSKLDSNLIRITPMSVLHALVISVLKVNI
jgi:hypothetical protein